jgi:hypothetical protein
LVQWLSQAAEMPLVEESYSFHDLALDWMAELWNRQGPPAGTTAAAAPDRWALSRRFLDCLEANAEEYWQAPQFELGGPAGESGDQPSGPPEDQADGLFGAAYDEMSYRDSTDDGFEGEMLEGGQDPGDLELVMEAERIFARLKFLETLAQLWKMAAVASSTAGAGGPDRDQVLAGWLAQAAANRKRLGELLDAVYRYRIPPPRGSQESLVEYDRRRGLKETLLEQVIATMVEVSDAGRLIRAVMDRPPPPDDKDPWQQPLEGVFRSLLGGDAAAIRKKWRDLRAALSQQPLLYVALARGGNPRRIVASRSLQVMLRRLLGYLPRLGLLRETAQLIETVQEMEMTHPVGAGAITEFDQLFQIGCKSIVRAVVAAAGKWRQPKAAAPLGRDAELIGFLEQVAEALLRCWLVHSRGVRLSVLETVHDKSRWRELKSFIQRYGRDLFTQRFMNLGNLRAIHHQGVDAYLQALLDESDSEEQFQLLTELDGPLPRDDAVRWLAIAIEAVIENYAEYVDYNSTTTQSDRGDMLYTLLDYLRLRSSYDRVAWNLQPVVLTHEVLVRAGRDAAAQAWRNAVAERTADIADDHLKRFARLNRKYGMRLPSIAQRLDEQFIRPLEVDQLRALVRPAMEELQAAPRQQSAAAEGAFRRLEEAVARFTQDVSGAGFDLPAWLEALQEEVDRVESEAAEDDELPGPELPVPQVNLSCAEVRRQVKAISEG